MNSFTEENYLKSIYQLSRKETGGVSTNSIAGRMETKASSATDMIKKLAAKKLVHYKKYQGVQLTEKGKSAAIKIIRKHRLWEVFLVSKLGFKWDEVHSIAEELEHIRSEELVDRLDNFLEYPKFDPHGDPIPDKNGEIFHHKEVLLSDLANGESGVVIGVKDSSSDFLQYLESVGLVLGTRVTIQQLYDYDHSIRLQIGKKTEQTVSNQVGSNLYVKRHLN